MTHLQQTILKQLYQTHGHKHIRNNRYSNAHIIYHNKSPQIVIAQLHFPTDRTPNITLIYRNQRHKPITLTPNDPDIITKIAQHLQTIPP